MFINVSLCTLSPFSPAAIHKDRYVIYIYHRFVLTKHNDEHKAQRENEVAKKHYFSSIGVNVSVSAYASLSKHHFEKSPILIESVGLPSNTSKWWYCSWSQAHTRQAGDCVQVYLLYTISDGRWAGWRWGVVMVRGWWGSPRVADGAQSQLPSD